MLELVYRDDHFSYVSHICLFLRMSKNFWVYILLCVIIFIHITNKLFLPWLIQQGNIKFWALPSLWSLVLFQLSLGFLVSVPHRLGRIFTQNFRLPMCFSPSQYSLPPLLPCYYCSVLLLYLLLLCSLIFLPSKLSIQLLATVLG